MGQPFQIYMQDVQYTCDPKTAVTVSNNYVYHTNLPTVTNLPTILLIVNSQLYWFTYIFEFVFELAHVNLAKLREKGSNVISSSTT